MDTSTGPTSSTEGSAKPLTPAQRAASADLAKARDAKQDQEKKIAEQKQAARKRDEAIRLALWPTPAAERDVCQKSMTYDINYRRLWSSGHFRDAWHDFSSLKQPTGDDRSKVINCAVFTLRKKEGRTDQAAQKRGETKEIQFPSHSIKRDRSSSSSSSSVGSTVLRPSQFKIPKRSDPTQATAISKTAPPPVIDLVGTTSNTPKPATPLAAVSGGAMETNDDATPKVVEAEEDEPALDQFTADMTDALGNYADAAKGKTKKKVDYPYLLYIHKGTELRETINKETWKVFLAKAQAAIMDDILSNDDGFSPNVDWTGHKNGTGVIATTDEMSQEHVRHIVSTVTVEGQSFRAWKKGDREEKTFITVKVPSSMRAYDSDKIVQVMSRANRIEELSWNLLEVRQLHESGERILKLTADEDAISRIKALGGEVKVGLSKLEVHHRGKKLTT
ncbi:MAG: DUF4780 domain-containing protein [Bacteroidota bacterium]